jgi:hypothetical protein
VEDKSEESPCGTPHVVDRQTLFGVGFVVAGVAVAWRPAATLLVSPGFEFVGVGAAIPVVAVVVGGLLVARGIHLLNRTLDQ